jgi:hypothetical protein
LTLIAVKHEKVQLHLILLNHTLIKLAKQAGIAFKLHHNACIAKKVTPFIIETIW